MYQYHKLHNAFPKFYRSKYKFVEKYHATLKKLLQGMSNPELFNGDLFYKLKKVFEKPYLYDPSEDTCNKRNRFKNKGYTLNSMQHTAYLVFDQIIVDSFAVLYLPWMPKSLEVWKIILFSLRVYIALWH